MSENKPKLSQIRKRLDAYRVNRIVIETEQGECALDLLTLHDALVSSLGDAVHRVRWLKQFVTDTPPIEEELARWDALIKASK